ncbi:TRAP transporter small permease [Bacilliculturomica massiliensis]|uniref:TRAP transporter small permease n=1 Tax=Bacilliculturomica massiliensis TaxID=1917867 RepID=UPI0010301CD3|nr:TRAP transporter small permease [Bacilliculturomica massiliensis]
MKYIFLVFDKIEEAGMAIGMLIMVIMNFFNVVCRFLLPQTPFSYTEELTVLIFIWVTMLGISCGYKRASHTGLNILTDKLHGVPKEIVVLFAMVCSAAFAALLFYEGVGMVQNQLAHGQVMPGLQISAAFSGMSLPCGAVFIFIRSIQAGLREWNEVHKLRKEA